MLHNQRQSQKKPVSGLFLIEGTHAFGKILYMPVLQVEQLPFMA